MLCKSEPWLLALAVAWMAAGCQEMSSPGPRPNGGNSRRTGQAKIDPRIVEVMERLKKDGVTSANARSKDLKGYSSPLVRVDADASLQVYLKVTDAAEGNQESLRKEGVRVEIVNLESKLIQAWVPCERVEAVAALPFVQAIQRPSYGRTR